MGWSEPGLGFQGGVKIGWSAKIKQSQNKYFMILSEDIRFFFLFFLKKSLFAMAYLFNSINIIYIVSSILSLSVPLLHSSAHEYTQML